MRDVPIPAAAVQDPWGKNVPGRERDPARTPMQWEDGPRAGFTAGAPWLPLAADSPQVNVETQRRDPRSLLHLYRRLLSLRATEPALQTGRYTPVHTDEHVFAYRREHFVVALNFGSAPVTVHHPEARGQITLSTVLDREGEAVSGALPLRGDEGVLICTR
jgi:alpha-glucosidase